MSSPTEALAKGPNDCPREGCNGKMPRYHEIDSATARACPKCGQVQERYDPPRRATGEAAAPAQALLA